MLRESSRRTATTFCWGTAALTTSALYGAGRYSLSHWKLESSSRGLLVIATLVVPLWSGLGLEAEWSRARQLERAAQADKGVAHTGGSRQQWIGHDICGLNRLPGCNAQRDQGGVLGEWISLAVFDEGGGDAQKRHPFNSLTIIRQEHTEQSPAQPQRPLQHRVALSNTASNTGFRSPGEALMTCNTSAVAVCCSSASCCSLINRAFSIVITAWAAKFSSRAICLSENARTSWRKIEM